MNDYYNIKKKYDLKMFEYEINFILTIFNFRSFYFIFIVQKKNDNICN